LESTAFCLYDKLQVWHSANATVERVVIILKVLYHGKTKTVLEDPDSGAVYLYYEDSATGENGVFDPGSNTVGGSVAGKGKMGLAVSRYFFELMEKNGIPTHYLGADIEQRLMQVRRLTVPKLEFVLRYFTAGSMCRRYTLPEGIPFDPPYWEVTLKDDEQGDPLISERLCLMKNLLREGQYDEALDILFRVGEVLKKELASMDLTLIDFKIEIGYDEDGKMYVADEISPDIWRVRDSHGNIPDQIACTRLILEKIEGR
jgi:phosphoribosylaminoimidazole-succinocarboxamide synthase